jgi:catechol 2,3-dioxygenase-like lactoylglutathione lyase family enzyme
MSAVATKTLITHLEYVSVQVKDQEAARNFYVDVLGFEVDEDKSYPDGQRWLTVKAPGAQTKLVLFADPHAHEEGGCCGSGGCGSCGPSYAWTGMVLGTEDVQAAYDELSGRGVTFLQEPQEKPWGKDALLADPDGNVFNLVQK